MLVDGWLPVSMVVAVGRWLGVESERFWQAEAAAPKGSLSLLMTLRAGEQRKSGASVRLLLKEPRQSERQATRSRTRTEHVPACLSAACHAAALRVDRPAAVT